MTDAIHFNGHTRGDHREFSNFYSAPIVVDGYSWATTEHFFQAQKFVPGGEKFMAIQRCSDPYMAKRIGNSRTGEPLRSDWEERKEDVMRAALVAKFSQHPDLKLKLLMTGDADIIEASPSDPYWGWGAGRDGKNRLGALLVEVREKLSAKPFVGEAHGFTLVELMIVIAIVGTLAALGIYGIGRACNANESATAEPEARAWAQQMGLQVVGAACSDVDSDGDGYVSCTLTVRDGASTKLVPVECGSSWGNNKGCRIPAGRIAQ